MPVSFWDYVSLGRPQWRGETSSAKALFFLLLGSPDAHTRIRNSHVLNLIQQFDLPSESNVLELGSGRGVSLFWLARNHTDWQLTGIDLDVEMASISERAARNGQYSNLSFQTGAAEDLDITQGVDIVLCIDALEHIEDDYGLLVKIRQALKPEGYLVLHIPRRRHDQWRWLKSFRRHEVEGHVGDEYEEEEIRGLLERAGFRVLVFQQTFGKWGEISFELNMLAWSKRWLRNLLALLTYPIAILIGYRDLKVPVERGNSFLVAAQLATFEVPK